VILVAVRRPGELHQAAVHGLHGRALAALMKTSLPAGRRLLDELYQVGLLQEIRPGRYDWHVLVRAYAAGLPTPDRRRPHANLCRPSTAKAVTGVHSKIAAGGGAPRGCSRR